MPRTLVFPAKNTTAQPSRLFWQGAGDEAGWWNPWGETEDKKNTGDQEGIENNQNALETPPREQGERGGLVKLQQWHSLARWSDWISWQQQVTPSMCVCVCVCVCACVCLCVSVSLSLCACACNIYIYIHIYIHMYIHTHTYTYKGCVSDSVPLLVYRQDYFSDVQ